MNPFTVSRYSVKLKKRIVQYNRVGLTVGQIRRVLLSKDFVKTSYKSIKKFLSAFQKSGVFNLQRRGASNVKVTAGHIQFINMWINQNNEISSHEIVQKLLKHFNLNVSRATISCIRKRLGWKYKKVAYCQQISQCNKLIRLTICIEWWNAKEAFEDVVFVDESTVEVDRHGRFHFYKSCGNTIAPRTSKRQKPKHPYKVLIWGGISYRGRTSVCVFKGIMDSISYQQILSRNLVPFGSRMYPDGYRLYQDNDPKHNSKSTVAFYERSGIRVVKTPASSPDLNTIENVWGSMKDYLLRTVKPTTKAQLISGIEKFWLTLSPAACARYINHIHKVIPKVILCDGGPTGY